MGLKRHSQQLGSRVEASSREKDRRTTDGAILLLKTPPLLALFILLGGHRLLPARASPADGTERSAPWQQKRDSQLGQSPSYRTRFPRSQIQGCVHKTKGAKRAGGWESSLSIPRVLVRFTTVFVCQPKPRVANSHYNDCRMRCDYLASIKRCAQRQTCRLRELCICKAS